MIARIVSLLVVSASLALAGGAGWTENYEAAKAQAKKDGKPILLDFTGSDWCHWCQSLNKDVFEKPEFKQYAKDSLVLVDVDFPQGKRQSHKIEEQNQKLKKEFGITGFPTIILVDADGKVLGRTGYRDGGATKYVDHLKSLLAKK